MCRTSGALEKRRWDRLLIGWRTLWRFVFQRVRLLRDARLSPQKTRGVPTNRGKAWRYTQTVLRARGGEERDARLSPQKARGVPTNRDKAWRYTQTVLSARGGGLLRTQPFSDPG